MAMRSEVEGTRRSQRMMPVWDEYDCCGVGGVRGGFEARVMSGVRERAGMGGGGGGVGERGAAGRWWRRVEREEVRRWCGRGGWGMGVEGKEGLEVEVWCVRKGGWRVVESGGGRELEEDCEKSGGCVGTGLRRGGWVRLVDIIMRGELRAG